MELVDAYQARRILDRVVGYKISPILWKKVKKGLSAGRVQSVVTRLICDREEEIEAFVPKEYWSIEALLQKQDEKPLKKNEFTAKFYGSKSKKMVLNNKEEADKVLADIEGKDFKVLSVKESDKKRSPADSFTTSTMQQEAARKTGFPTSKTMLIAQQLFEGVDLGRTGGLTGLVTYIRTDSTRISDEAAGRAREFISETYGEDYLPKSKRIYKNRNSSQDAHEAIRPSYPERTPESIKQYLQPDQYKLYKLIWDKFMSSQMAPAEIANKTIDIKAGDYNLKAGTSKILFDGFLKLYNDAEEDEKDADAKIPDLEQGDKVKCKEITPKQHFTQPPPRYNEASLVKALEEHGIGRPSTYATIITVIQTRKYVEKKDKALYPTLLGRTVCKQLVNQFANIMDYKFTAGMEEKLDKIAEKKAVWNVVLKEFYTPFMEVVNSVMKTAQKVVIESDKKCPNCGKVMLVKTSRFGTQFLGCSGYPECKTIISLNNSVELDDVEGEGKEQQTVDEKCEKCGSEMVMKVGPYGKYLECKECKNRKKYIRSTGVKCPKCGEGTIIEKKSKYGKIFFGCIRYPECSYALWDEPTGNKCPECGELLVKKVTKNGNFEVCSSRTCTFKHPLEDVKESEKPE